MPRKAKKKIKFPVPERFKKFLILISACQNMELIPPAEMYMNIVAYFTEKRGIKCMEKEKLAKLQAYIRRWSIKDFTKEE